MHWPPKRRLLAVDLSVTEYSEATAAVCDAAEQQLGGAVGAISIHGIVHATRKPVYADYLNSLEMATPDGQGSRWALNWLYGVGLRDRVYGPQLMLHICREAAVRGLSVYLYGSTPQVLVRLQERLAHSCPALRIVGSHSPPFRPLTPAESTADLDRIRRSGAKVVFVGLGCPRQEVWIAENRSALSAVLVSVGAAFDFISGNKPQAPSWAQKIGLEMAYRALTEPRRLGPRFLSTSPAFVFFVILQKLGLPHFGRAHQPSKVAQSRLTSLPEPMQGSSRFAPPPS